MPIFEYKGKDYEVSDEHAKSFAQEYPDASIIMRRGGDEYRVKLNDYDSFISEMPTQTKDDTPDFRSYTSPQPKPEDTTVQAPTQSKPEAQEQSPVAMSAQMPVKQQQPEQSATTVKAPEDIILSGQLRRARTKLDELQAKRNQRASEVHDEATEFNKKNLNALGRLFVGGDIYVAKQQSDPEKNALDVAIRQTEELIKDLEEQQDRENGVDVGFWRGFGRVAGDVRSWDRGMSNAKDAITMLNADRLVDKNATEGERAAYNDMMEAIYNKEQAEQAYGGNASFWNRAGVMTGHMPSFMLDFAMTGGGFKGLNMLSTGATKAATKALGKEVVDEMAKQGFKTYVKNNGAKGLGQYAADWTIKALGTTGDDLLVRAPLMTNTVQAGSTVADIVDRKLGGVTVNEDGTYDFSNNKEWSSAIWQGEANSIIENYSEMFGSHLDPVVTFGNMSKLANVVGAKRLGSVLAKADAGALSGVMGQTQKLFGKMGVSDYFGEVAEEYYGQLWRTMLNLDDAYQPLFDEQGNPVYKKDEQGNILLDEEGNPIQERVNNLSFNAPGNFHGDIWGGMALSMGLMGAGKHTLTGAQYLSMKHGVNKADSRAAELLGKNVWEPLRQTIDQTTNDDIGSLAERIVSDPDFTNDELAAVFTYMERSLNMRGFNLGALAQKRGGEGNQNAQSMDEHYIDGYNINSPQEMTDAKNMYDMQRQRVVDALGEDVLADIDRDPEAAIGKLGEDEPTNRTVIEYLNAKMVYDGMNKRVADDADARMAESDALVDAHTHKKTGMVQGAVMKENDRKVYIVNGNVVPLQDGTGIDLEASDNSIIIRDAESGNLEQVSPEVLLNVDAEIDPTAEKQAAREAIASEVRANAERMQNGVVGFAPGDVYTVLGEDGNTHQVEIVQDNGDDTVAANVDGEPVNVMTKEQIQNEVDAYNKQRVVLVADSAQGAEAAENAEAAKPNYELNAHITMQTPEGVVTGNINQAENDDNLIEVQVNKPFGGKKTVDMYTREELDNMVVEVADENGNVIWSKPAENAEAAANVQDTENVNTAPTSRIMRKKGDIDADSSFENGATAQEMADAYAQEYGEEEGLPLRIAQEQLAQIKEEREKTKDLNRKHGSLRKKEKFWSEVVDLLTPKEETVAEEGRQETVGTPVALQYLLEGGKGSIENAGYFFYAIQAAFPHIGAQLQEIRNSMPAEMLGMAPDAFVASNPSQLQEVRGLVEATYGKAGTRILDQMLANSTGFYPREGKALDLEIENLKPVEGNEQTQEVMIVDPTTMSDEEKQRRGDMLRNAPAVDVQQGVITSTPDMSARKAAEKWWDENVDDALMYNTEVGEVEINKNSIESSLAHRYGQRKLDAITSLVEGFENAVYLGTLPDGTRQEGVNNHYFAYPINYNGERCYVFCRAMQDANKNRLYVHEVFVEDRIKKGDTLQTAASQPHGGIALYKDILANVLDAPSEGKGTDKSVTAEGTAEEISENARNATQSEQNELEKTEKERIDALVPTIEDVADGMQTADEFVAGLFGNGIRITPESFRKETGQGREEQRRLVGIIAGKEKGGLTVEQAAETIVENYRAELAERGFSGDSMEMRDMVIDILSSGNPRAYAKQEAARRAEQALRREMEAFDRYTQEAFHMSAEEYIMYEESMLPKYIEQYKDFDEQEYYSNFADEQSTQNEHDTTRESAETGGSREILSQEQPSATPGEGAAGEGQQGGTLQGDVQGDAKEGLARAEAGQEVADKSEGRPLLWERGAETAPEDVASPTIATITPQQGDEDVSRTKSQSNASSGYKDTDNPQNNTNKQGVISENAGNAKSGVQTGRTRFSASMFEDAERIAREEQRRAPLRRTARAWEKILGVKVTLMERLEDVKDPVARREIEAAEKKGSKKVPGWYSDTEGVFLYLPHVENENEVDKTCVHEIVSHKGLKELLGQEKFDELCRKVWGIMSPAARKKYRDYPNVHNELEAADEFIAHLSEEVELNARERSVWQKIMDFIAGLLGRKADNRSKASSIVGKETLSRKDIAELVRLSYAEYLQRNGRESEKSAEGNVRLRFSKTPQEFDAIQKEAVEKKGIVMPGLNGAVLNVVDAQRHDFTGTGKDAIKKAEKWANQNIAKEHIYHEGLDDEFKYIIDDDAIGKFLSQSSTKGSDNLGVHLAVLKKLPDVINNSIEVEIHPDYKKVDKVRSAENGVGNSDLLVHRLYAAVDIEGQVYRAKTTIHEFKNKQNKAYDYRITKVELIISGSSASNALNSSTSISAAKLLKGVEKSYDKGKKILDESEKISFRVLPNERLRKLDEGETCNIERVFTQQKMFNFSSGEKIESYEDVAYIFRSLEDEAVENAFVALVKNGKPTIVHLGMGTATQSTVDQQAVIVAVERIKPDAVYLVHNHPSGNLKASRQDAMLLDSMKKAYGDIVKDGIIINLRSGKYSVFNEEGSKIEEATPNAPEKVTAAKTYSFSKRVFDKDFDVEELMHVTGSDAADTYAREHGLVAALTSSQRLGERGKLSLLVISQGSKIVGNVFLNHTEVLPSNLGNISKEIAYYVSAMGGQAGILYGRFGINETRHLGGAVNRASAGSVRMLDAISMTEFGGYVSALDEGVMEETPSYGKGETRFRVSNDNQEIFVSNAQRAVEGIKQEKGTPQQWLAMIEKNGGLKAGEDKWLGLSDWLKGMDQKSVTKQEILDFIGENKIRIEEVTYGEEAGGYSEEKLDEFNAEYEELIWEGEEETGSIYANDWADYAYEAMVARYGDDFRNAFDTEGIGTGSRLVPHYYYDGTLSEEAKQFVGEEGANDNEINSTRLEYTTEGLDNKQEIALTVPTIEPWNQSDDIHFGDAGGGRAVAWIRFGEANDADGNAVLVIDEIQSKRHQEGREKGYNNPRVIQILDRMNEIQVDLYSPYGVPEEVHAEKKALQEELKAAFESENPQMKKVAEQIKEKEARLGELNREKAEKENDEKVEMLKLQDRQLETRNVREYDYYEQEINNIKEAQERRDDEIDELRSSIRSLNEEYSHYYNTELRNARAGVMPAPFEKNWHELAMKRMLRYAAENGFDKVAWTTGAQQAERYNLGKYFSDIEREDNPSIEGRRFVLHGGNVEALHVDESGNVIESTIEEAIGKPLVDVVGKSMADRMMSMDNGDMIEGEDLRIGGEGMKGFYDKMLPSFVQKYTKKWGAKVGEVELPHLEEGAQKMWSVDVTPEMKESVMEGQTMFRVTDDIKDANARFNEELETLNEENADRIILSLGRPSDILISAGVEDKPMKLYGNKVIKKMKKHGFAISELFDLPSAVADPIAVFDNLGREGNRSVLTELKTANGNFLVSLDLGKGEEIDFNIVSSVFGKGEDNIVDWIERGLSTYINKEKALNYLHHSALHAVALRSSRLDSAAKVIKDFQNPSVGGGIRFRNVDKLRERYDKMVRLPNKIGSVKWYENLPYRLREAYQDSMLSLKILQDVILEETGNTMTSGENAYMAENQMSSKNKAEAEMYERDFFKPMMEEVKNLLAAGATYDEVQKYLFAKHGLERNMEMYKKNKQEAIDEWIEERTEQLVNDGMAQADARAQAQQDIALYPSMSDSELDKKYRRDYSGLTALTGKKKVADAEAEATQMVSDFEGRFSTADLWDKINAATRETLRKSYDSGMMDKATYNKILGMYHYYIPLRGWDADVAENEYEYLSDRGMNLSPVLVKTEGRTSLADDPIATIGFMAEGAIVQGNRNLMKQRFMNFVLNNPTSLVSVSKQWYVEQADGTWVPDNPQIPADATGDQVAAIVEQHEQKMLSLGKKAKTKRAGLKLDLHATKQEGQEHMVRVKRGGKEYCLYINGSPRAAQALNGMTNPDASNSSLYKAASAVKNFMARMFTSQNPAFVVSNLSRDLLWAGTAVAVRENKDYAARYTKNVGKAFKNATLPRLLHKYQNGTLDMNVEEERLFMEFIKHGGETGFTQITSVEDYKKDIKRFVKEVQKGKFIGKKIWDGFFDTVEFLNRSAEDTTRFMVYMTSRQMGRDVATSVSDAKEITVNFNKKGSGDLGASVMNFCYIFFNAAIQSLSGFGKMMAEHPKRTLAGLTAYASAGVIVPAMSIALQALTGDDDDESYWDLPEWIRRNNLVLYVPFTDSGFITIPLPHELRPFYAMGEIALSAMCGREDVEDGLRKVAMNFAEMLPLDFTGNGGNLAVNLTPTVAQPAAQIIANKDYTGKPIYKDYEWNKRDPEWTKAYKGTSPWIVEGTKWLNRLSGGDDVKSGAVDLNPALIEHVLESYTGGAGKTFNRTMKTFQMMWDEDMRQWRNVPVISSFVQSGDERIQGSDVNNRYYEAKDEFEDTKHLLSGYKKQKKEHKPGTAGYVEYARKLDELMNSDEYKRYKVFKGRQKAIKKVSDKLKETDDRNRIDTLNTRLMQLKEEMLEELEKADDSPKP